MRERSRPSQVGELLRCLNIDPAALPAGAMPGAERDAWDGIFHAGGPRLPEAAAAAEVAAGGRLAAAARPGGMCAPTQQRAGGAGTLQICMPYVAPNCSGSAETRSRGGLCALCETRFCCSVHPRAW